MSEIAIREQTTGMGQDRTITEIIGMGFFSENIIQDFRNGKWELVILGTSDIGHNNIL